MVAAAVGAAATIGGAVISSDASRSASNTQADAARNAADAQMQQFQQMRSDLQPYMNLGSGAISPLMSALGYNSDWSVNQNNPLQQRFNFTMPTLEQVRNTPGYQFQTEQGQNAINNSAAARGGLLSGATLKDLLSFQQGLADTTYQRLAQTQFDNTLTAFKTNYSSAADNANRLSNLVQTGQNSAAGVGQQGLQAANNAGNMLTSGAAASAAGTVGSANAINQGLGSLANAGMTYGRLNQLLNLGGSVSSYGPATGFSESAPQIQYGGGDLTPAVPLA